LDSEGYWDYLMADEEVIVGWMYSLGGETRNVGRPFGVVSNHFE